ncbi:MAG: hypothetical protein JW951_02465 [Lentisphaerae bacterium]|nr:hypothetical protein [Lentisphaerota bacterium]
MTGIRRLIYMGAALGCLLCAGSAAATNLLHNSGFELGQCDIGLGRIGGESGEAGVVENGPAFEGTRSLRLAVTPAARRIGYRVSGDAVDNRGYWVQVPGARVAAGRPYVLSAYVRGDAGMRASLGVSASGLQFYRSSSTSPFRPVSNAWRRVVLRIPADFQYHETPGLLVNLFIDSAGQEAGRVWFDALQLEPGADPGTYAPRQGLDLGVTTPVPLNIYGAADGPPRVEAVLALCNGDAAPRAVTVPYVFSAWDGRTLQRGSLSLDVPPGETVRRAIDLGALERGYYIGDFKIEGTDRGRWLRVAVIRKRPVPVPPDVEDRFFGMHVYRGPGVVSDAIVAAGARTAREYQGQWINATPPPGDEPATRHEWTGTRRARYTLKPRGLDTLVGVNQDPVWIDGVATRLRRSHIERQPRTPAEMQAMLRAWAAANRDWLTAVESRNEVYSYIPMPGGDVSGFMQYFRLFYEAVKDAAPDMRVVHNVIYDISSIHNLLGPCMEAGLTNVMDVLSFHYYGFGAVDPEEYVAAYIEDIQRIMAEHGAADTPLWLTEGGGGSMPCEDDPYIDRALYQFPPLRTSELEVAQLMVRMHLVARAMGVERVYYFTPYDYQGVPGYNGCNGLMRYDGLPRWGYAAYAYMTERLEDRAFVEEVRLDDDTARAYVFDGARDVTVVLTRGLRGTAGRLRVPADGVLAGGSWCDMMGGRLSMERVGGHAAMAFDAAPRYLVFAKPVGMDAAACAAAVRDTAILADVTRPAVRGKVPPRPEGTTYFIEAEDALEHSGGEITHRPGLYGGKAFGRRFWLKDMPEGGFTYRYSFYVVGNNAYRIWIAGWPVGGFSDEDSWVSPMDYRIDGGAWQAVSQADSPVTWSSEGVGKGEVDDLYWMRQQPVFLETGEHSLEIRVNKPRDFARDNEPNVVFMLDAIAVTKEE